MKILRTYLRREVVLHAGLGLLLFTFVIFMQDLGRALEATVSAGPMALLSALALVLPQALVFTLPMAVLVGLLIGLGRLGTDNELTALRASGVGARRLVGPLLQVALSALGLALALTLWLAPWALRSLENLTAQWTSAAATAEVQPRVFFEPEQNSNWVVYIGGTAPGGRIWRQVLVADMRDQASPVLTMAQSGELVHGGAGQVQLHLMNGAQYTSAADAPQDSTVSSFNAIDIPFAIPRRATVVGIGALPLGALWRQARYGANWREARVEFYRRFALAFACLALALLGIPLGLRGGRGGKSGGFVLTLLLVLVYYMIFILGMGFARQGKLPLFWGVWAANWIFMILGAWAITRLDRIPRQIQTGADPAARVRAGIARLWSGAPGRAPLYPTRLRRRWLPSLLEGYVVREFLGYTGLLLASFLVLVLVFTLFELAGDILQNHIGVGVVLEYLLYFSPQMLYMMIPVAILVGVLITFGLMSKANEITALKASGVSAYRLLVPIVFAAVLLSGLQFALDATWLPGFNQKQDALHAQIKGQPPQTFHDPEHKWVIGQNNDIYYFSFYDPGRREFEDVSVYEFDPQRFQLTRRIFARTAEWSDAIQGWVFSNGWVRQINGDGGATFRRFQVANFNRLPERPAYFATDARQGTQMTYNQLRRYIHALRGSGYDVARLSVTLAQKIAYPLITVIMALLAFPFALTVGRRGTVAGITVAIVVAIVYWSSSSFLQALGNLSQLPAQVAAWTPDVMFFGMGIYLLLRVPT